MDHIRTVVTASSQRVFLQVFAWCDPSFLLMLLFLGGCLTTKTVSLPDSDVHVDAGMSDAQSDGTVGPCGGCSGATPLCDTANEICVACLQNSDCTSAGASVCSSGMCIGCSGNNDCSHLTGVPACDTADSTCVECTIATESANCGLKSGVVSKKWTPKLKGEVFDEWIWKKIHGGVS